LRQSEVCCAICGQQILWEHPVGSGHFQHSSSYIGGNTCRDCMEEHCCQTNCLQCEVGHWPDCPYRFLKSTD